MEDKIYIARIFAYPTPGENAKGNFSVGMSVASKLNGNQFWVGTYVAGAKDDRKVGFITNPDKFPTQEAADLKVAELSRVFKRGAEMSAKDWEWGDEMVESSIATGANVYAVRYKGHDVSSPQAAAASVATPASATTAPAT